jgi:hypothetical protein
MSPMQRTLTNLFANRYDLHREQLYTLQSQHQCQYQLRHQRR